ncbi:MAG: hypothetical protein K0R48_1105 [Gammaproteobacteria bacterium]|jgi:hypothetical protein|nr:hypothetical protein [Gammaproteobacteria bacterium]
MTLIPTLSRYYGTLFKTTMGSVRLASSKKNFVRFDPELSKGAKIIIPISFSRYIVDNNISVKKAREYDDFLGAIFERTSYLLHSGIISRVDVLATGDLQRINWDNSLVDKVEQHFFNTHKAILSEQSHTYKWDEWIEVKGKDFFEEKYRNIVDRSRAGSDWHTLMLKTQNSLKIGSSTEQSLEYQRREYAAVSMMDEYSHLVYAGPMSVAWAYLYSKYFDLPIFSQAKFEKAGSENQYIPGYDAEQITRMLLSNVKQILTSPSFPPGGKEKLIDEMTSLFYTYGHFSHNKAGVSNETGKDAPVSFKCK